MTEAVIAQKGPYRLTLQPGTYWWCACGQSRNQPFCDGSHKRDGVFMPVKLDVTVVTEMFLCGCKRSAKLPLCDGTHKQL